MTTRNTSAHGLPKFRPGELAAIKAEGYTAILVLDVGGSIAFGISGDPNRYVRNLADKMKRPTRVLRLAWAPDAHLARQIKSRIEALLCDRRIPGSDLFDLPEEYALATPGIVASKIGLKLATTDEILNRGDVQRTRYRIKTRRHLTSTVI